MAKKNYPEELLDLLQEYLTDGVIRPDEREVLINKATSLGVDPREFNLFIVAQEQKLQIVAAEAEKQKKGRLCPFCQASLPMFNDTCPVCGNYVTPEASKEVEELINALEKALVDFKAAAADRESWSFEEEKYVRKKAKIEGHIRKAKMYYANNKTISFLVEDFEKTIVDSDKRIAAADKKGKIKTFLLCIPGAIISLAFWWWVIKKFFI